MVEEDASLTCEEVKMWDRFVMPNGLRGIVMLRGKLTTTLVFDDTSSQPYMLENFINLRPKRETVRKDLQIEFVMVDFGERDLADGTSSRVKYPCGYLRHTLYAMPDTHTHSTAHARTTRFATQVQFTPRRH